MLNTSNVDFSTYEDVADKVIVALDCDIKQAINLASLLKGRAKWLKIGMSMFYRYGPKAVSEFKSMGYSIFLDLKTHDIPFQVQEAIYNASICGADMLTVHTLGASDMLKAAVEGANRALKSVGTRPVLLGVTVLTSMDDNICMSVGIKESVLEEVILLCDLAKNAGLDGVVASGNESSMIRERYDKEFEIVTPGIRLSTCSNDDQVRVLTPKESFENGSTYIVVGRPITLSQNPVKSFDDIIYNVLG